MRGMLRYWALMGCPAAVTASAAAGTSDWVEFVDQTDTRLIADLGVGAEDPQEKDYAWGDVDNDGDIDLVVVRKLPGSNSGGKRNVLFMNEGGVLVDRTVEFATDADDGGQGFLDLTPDRDVALVDVDQDGWLDVVTAVAGAFGGGPKTITHPRIYINLQNDAAGNWLGLRYEEARIPQLPQTPNFHGVGFGDVDGHLASNGAPDLYFADATSSLEDRLLVNDGGFFTDETELRTFPELVTSEFAPHAVIADLNDDGYNDILKVAALGPSNVRLAYNDADNVGFFNSTDSQIIYTGDNWFVATGDLNNDSMLDIVVIDHHSLDSYFLNQGNGPDGLATFIGFTFPNSNTGFDNNAVIADLDNDGYHDVLVADVDVDLPGCTFNRLKIHHNLGNPPNVTFEEDVGNLPADPGGPLFGTHDVAVFDLNGDGWNDLVIGTCDGTTVWISQPRPCPADIDRNGAINVLDLIDLLLCFGQPVPPCGPADVNHDGTVNVLDLIDLLLAFGTACP